MMKPFGNAYETEMLNKADAGAGQNRPWFDRDTIADAMSDRHVVSALMTTPKSFTVSIDPGTVFGPSPTGIFTATFVAHLPGEPPPPPLESERDASKRYMVVRAALSIIVRG